MAVWVCIGQYSRRGALRCCQDARQPLQVVQMRQMQSSPQTILEAICRLMALL